MRSEKNKLSLSDITILMIKYYKRFIIAVILSVLATVIFYQYQKPENLQSTTILLKNDKWYRAMSAANRVGGVDNTYKTFLRNLMAREGIDTTVKMYRDGRTTILHFNNSKSTEISAVFSKLNRGITELAKDISIVSNPSYSREYRWGKTGNPNVIVSKHQGSSQDYIRRMIDTNLEVLLDSYYLSGGDHRKSDIEELEAKVKKIGSVYRRFNEFQDFLVSLIMAGEGRDLKAVLNISWLYGNSESLFRGTSSTSLSDKVISHKENENRLKKSVLFFIGILLITFCIVFISLFARQERP